MERRNTHTVFVEPVPYRTKLFTQLNHVCFIVSRVVLVIAYNLVNVIIFLNKGCEEDFFEYGESSRRTICSCAQSRSHEYHILYCCKNATNCNDNFVPQYVIIIYYYDQFNCYNVVRQLGALVKIHQLNNLNLVGNILKLEDDDQECQYRLGRLYK